MDKESYIILEVGRRGRKKKSNIPVEFITIFSKLQLMFYWNDED